ncbi:GNAT family N-acetyltransferase [Kitasatospora sp. NPDC049285]|uniref:GNAT family N-acetyltransferase n=1 Tax=Kitasatospora sp. NPDC049285 TaxID=3157096 RepID=UPI003418925F
MLELTCDDELRAASGDDTLLMWAAQGFTTGARAWGHGRAVAVASPAVSGRDRIAVRGPVEELAPLLREVLPQTGPDYRPLGDAALIGELCAEMRELEWLGTFGWMDAAGGPVQGALGQAAAAGGAPAAEAESGASWLRAEELDEAAELIDRHFPSSYAHPHRPGARAWAGVRDGAGRLTALAADAWGAPTVGLLAGVVTDPEHGRGRGHGAAACGLVVGELLERTGRAALMVEAGNDPAIRLYRRLGLEWRELAAARQR